LTSISNSASISDFRCVERMLLFVTMGLTMIYVDMETSDLRMSIDAARHLALACGVPGVMLDARCANISG
jgi:hypothetical protein